MPRTLNARYIAARSISDDQLGDESVQSRAIKNYDVQGIDLANGLLEPRHFTPSSIPASALPIPPQDVDYYDGNLAPDCVSVDEFEIADVAKFDNGVNQDIVFNIGASTAYNQGIRLVLRFAVVDATLSLQPFKIKVDVRKKSIGEAYDSGDDLVASFVISTLDPAQQVQVADLAIEEDLSNCNLYLRLTRRSTDPEDTNDGSVLLLSVQTRAVV